MTWTKLSDDFGDQCAGLSDAAFRTHVDGLLWAMRRETDGAITERDLRRCAESDQWRDGVAELVRLGFWEQYDNGYLIVHHMEHQPESDVIARRRALTAERVRKHRRKQAGLVSNAVTHDVTNGVTEGVTERVTRDGSGRDGDATPNPGLEEKGRVCCVCGSPGSLLAGKDGRLRCRRHHFDQAAA